jgi:hypothetical protein
VDFIQSSTGLPVQAILIAPISDTVIHTDTAHFIWNDITGETKYHFQAATDRLMKTIVATDSALTSAKKILAGLKDGTQYFWRMRAKNTVG